jgi:deoxycytidylate deaminase
LITHTAADNQQIQTGYRLGCRGNTMAVADSDNVTIPEWNQGNHHEFVQRIVPLFEQQRNIMRKQYQFAVLFPSPHRVQDINAHNVIFQTQGCVVRTPSDAINTGQFRFPLDDMLCNYMTARPTRKYHAEVKLMEKFETLLNACKYNTQCRSIVLYSWLLPCHPCAELLIQKLQKYMDAFEIAVIYTSKQRDLKDEDRVSILKSFENARIKTFCVSFDQRLDRKSPLEHAWEIAKLD